MDDLAQPPRAHPDHLQERRIAGASDLAHLHQDVRALLAGVQAHAVTGAALVVVILCGDALRYGAPPVTLRLRRSPEGRCLRVEVEDHRPAGSGPNPVDYRISLLNRMTTDRGVRCADGATTHWAEIPLGPTPRP